MPPAPCEYGIEVFRKMEVGDSFWVEFSVKESPRLRSMMVYAREVIQPSMSTRFKTAREGNGYRVWRIE